MFIYIALLLIGIISLYYLTRKRHIDFGSLAPITPLPLVQQPILEPQNFRTITVDSFQYIFNRQGNLHQIVNTTERFSHIRFSFDGTRSLEQIFQDSQIEPDENSNNYTLPEPDN